MKLTRTDTCAACVHTCMCDCVCAHVYLHMETYMEITDCCVLKVLAHFVQSCCKLSDADATHIHANTHIHTHAHAHTYSHAHTQFKHKPTCTMLNSGSARTRVSCASMTTLRLLTSKLDRRSRNFGFCSPCDGQVRQH